MAEEAEDRPAAGVGVHRHIGRPSRADAFLGGEGAINRFRRRVDADAMDEVGGHNLTRRGFRNIKSGCSRMFRNRTC